MYFYRRYPRRRRYWRRRPRRFIRHRYWRRKRYYKRRYGVRKKRKLKSIILRQFQPQHIRKLKCKGTIPLFVTTSETVSRNFAMYWYEISPQFVPGGGGFSIINFKLTAFYQLFKKILCYWTQSNNTLPLIKYTGCTIKLYTSEHTDYIATYHNCLPMKPTLDTYNSTHPQMQKLNNRHMIIRCRQNRPNRKPYRKIKLRPPSQFTQKWYFQNEIADQSLLMLMVSAMSLDRYFAGSKSISTTIEFTSLNTNIFKFHNWKLNPTSGYYPKENTYLYALENGHQNIENEKVVNLIYLGQTKNIGIGKTIKQTQTSGQQIKDTFSKYTQDSTNWGNPFDPRYLTEEVPVYYSTKSPQQLLIHYTTQSGTFSETTQIGHGIMTTFTEKLLVECRYNPYGDYTDNNIFLEQNNIVTPHEWAQPTDPKLEGGPYPLWLSTWGFIDWQKNRLGPSADLDYVFVMVTHHIKPPLPFYVPIDEDFQKGRSPFQPDNTKPTIEDQLHWQPKVRFQLRTINNIASCGPATVRLPPQISAEAHADFTFHFKLGGCASPGQEIEDPTKQTQWPVPNNILQQPSLQSPSMPLESFIYNFDKRRDYITKRATERLQSISPIKESLLSITDRNFLHQETPQESSQSSEEETEKEALLRLINKQRTRQLKFKQRILQLIQQQSSE
nr:MAG: ORF1 [TTV-like mini virus]